MQWMRSKSNSMNTGKCTVNRKEQRQFSFCSREGTMEIEVLEPYKGTQGGSRMHGGNLKMW